MYEDLRDRAIANLEKRKKKVKAMQIVGVIFGSVAVFLYGITFLMHPADRQKSTDDINPQICKI